MSRAAVYDVAVTLDGLAAATGLPVEQVRALTGAWQRRALAYPERERGNGELWAVYAVLRGWLLAPERLDAAQRVAAHQAAGDFLREVDKQDQEGQLGLTWTDCLLEARAQYLADGDYAQAREVTARISGAYSRRGLYGEQERLTRELLLHDDHATTRRWLGRSLVDRGRYAEARAEYQRALAMLQQVGDRAGEAATWHQLATVDVYEDDYAAARASFQHSLTIKQQIGDRAGEAATWHQLATVDVYEGDYAAARASFQRSLTIKQQIGDRAGEAATWHQLATVDVYEGDYAAARASFQHSLTIKQQIGDRAGEAATWHQLATVDVYEGDYAAARASFQRALAMRQQIGDRAGEAATWVQLGILAAKQGLIEGGLSLVVVGLLLSQHIGHAQTQQITPWVNRLASQLSYTQEQFDAMRGEVAAAYQRDRGQALLRAAFGAGASE